ncbi:MAG: hypothetical protein KAH84_09395 [Thiomargarita sp.]|nr:hypothetical protein [Thiomargarita sp.]
MDKQPLIFIVITFIFITFFFLFRNKSETKIYDNYQKLLRRCFNDKAQVERLINYELKRNPNLSREKAAKDALESLIRDNN